MPFVLVGIGLFLIAAVAAHHEWLASATPRTAPAEPRRWPSVAVLRPIRGLDPGARENLDALLVTEYPGELEFVFLLDDDRDPSYRLVTDAIAAHPECKARVELTGEPPRHRTGKIHKMIVGAELTSADVLAFSDSDTRPSRRLLRELVAVLEGNERCGIAFAPTVAVADQTALGDVGYELLVNSWYGAVLDRASGDGRDVPFAMGHFMLIRVRALEAIGTMRAAEGQLVDDMFLGRRMVEHGYANAMGPTRVPIAIGGFDLGAFLRLFRKWLFFSKTGLPAAFRRAGWMRATPGLMAWALLATGISLRSVPVIASAVVALAVFVFSQVRLHRALGGAPVPARFIWLAAALPLIAAGVLASTKLRREVEWRGRHYRLDAAGQLVMSP